MNPPVDLARVRLDNALLLFDEFVQQATRHPDAATLRGLEGRFAERLQIQPSYWSQLKSRARQIGERLARQFERRMHKPHGWMDQVHRRGETTAVAPAEAALPVNDDERFVVALVLSYFRRDPQRARARLLELLGEALVPEPPAPAAGPVRGAAERDADLWRRTTRSVAPLKHRR
jgi:hypothetical protein